MYPDRNILGFKNTITNANRKRQYGDKELASNITFDQNIQKW